MDYKQKYLKYKTKYIGLKKGGAKQFYSPCEITNDVKKIYLVPEVETLLKIEDDLFRDISLILGDDKIIVESIGHNYKQDPAIFLKSYIDENDHAIVINEGLNLQGFVRIEGCQSVDGNDLGGNFISSPCSPKNTYGSLFCFDKITPNLSRYLENNLQQNLIQLECCFRSQDIRHIDECMCFMPYKDHYKVWIYKIRNISCTSRTQWGITSQIETGKIHSNTRKILNIESIKDYLDLERQRNIKKISENLFGEGDFSHFFVEFPIDLEIDHYYVYNKPDFKIKNIPIFNRLWYEKDNQCRAIFSNGALGTDPDVQKILDRELPLIGSIIDPNRIFKCGFINTQEYNNRGSAGGNLHCLVKMKY
jgi:hypothetical protein